jgi:NAD(P)H-flavin reductase
MASPVEEHEVTSVNSMLPQPFLVRRMRRETPDTFTIEIEPATSDKASRFAPGQFNMLYVFGCGEIAISICADPRGKSLMHTTRVVGTVTKAMAKLRRGDMLGVRGPFGSGWPIEQVAGRDVVLVAGGIGLAPLRGALCQLLRRLKRPAKVVLLYGVRTPEDILYRRELERWRTSGLQIYVTVDRATGSWLGHVGVVTTLIPRAPFDPVNTVALVCGPEVMMRYTALELQKRGVSETSIFLSMERNMKCAIGFCGHCQFGPEFICKDGPVFRYDHIKKWLGIWEL